MSELKNYLAQDLVKAKIQSYLTSKDTDAQNIIANCLFEVQKNIKLASCSQLSILEALIQCARYGLSPNSDLGHVYLIPYGQTCTVILGYKGMLRIAYRSSEITNIICDMIYKNDYFDYCSGTDNYLKHKKELTNRGEPIGCYAVAKLKNGESQFRVMTMDEINLARKSSKGGQIWEKHFDEMAKKTCIRSLFKLLHISTDLEEVIATDDKNVAAISQGIEHEFKPETEEEPKGKIEALEHRLDIASAQYAEAEAVTEEMMGNG